MKIAIVHDWLTGMRGGEKCLEVFCKLFPSADLYSLLHIPDSVSPVIESHPIHTSFIQNLPFVESKYRYYLPLMPMAIEQFDFSGYDLILSSSHCVAKSVKHGPKTLHICYCHTPTAVYMGSVRSVFWQRHLRFNSHDRYADIETLASTMGCSDQPSGGSFYS